MKIIQVHNYYQQAGGEDSVVAAERLMLEGQGNIVVPFYKTNDDILPRSNGDKAFGSKIFGLLFISLKTIWNHQAYSEFRELLQKEQPDVVHCHNTFPLISPSIYWACSHEKVPVVLTLHNYRLLCLNALLFRQIPSVESEGLSVKQDEILSREKSKGGGICEKCISKSLKLPGVRYGCYRRSKGGSLVVAFMLLLHRMMGTWSKKVSGYIALTDFQKQKMVKGGLPADKVWVKPNFIAGGDGVKSEGLSDKKNQSEAADPTLKKPDLKTGDPYALYVGRLSPEKGCDVLIHAWSELVQSMENDSCPQLRVVGSGAERERLERLVAELGLQSHITFLGQQKREDVHALMTGALFMIFPSVWYETFGLTVLESGLVGTPSLVSSPTTTADLIEDRQNGLLFSRSNPEDLLRKIRWALKYPDEMKVMGERAHQDFTMIYSQDANCELLVEIYQRVRRGEKA